MTPGKEKDINNRNFVVH